MTKEICASDLCLLSENKSDSFTEYTFLNLKFRKGERVTIFRNKFHSIITFMKLLIIKIPLMLFPNPFSHVVLQIQDLFSFQWNFLSFHIFTVFVELCICYTHRCPNPLPSRNSLILVYDIVLFPAYGTHFHMLTCTSTPSSQQIPTLVHQKLPVHLSSLSGKTVSSWKLSPGSSDSPLDYSISLPVA